VLARQKYFRVPQHRRQAYRGWWWPLAIFSACGMVTLGIRGAEGGFTASVSNVGGNARSASLLTSAVSGGTVECDLGTPTYNPIATINTATCAGTLVPSGPLPASGTSATTTTVTDKGSVAGTTGSVVAGTCGPVALANSVTSSDPMLIRGVTLSYAQAGPLTGGTGIGMSGTSGYAADVNAVAGPATTSFTEAIWFKTTSAGSLIGFTNTPISSGAGQWDKMLWVDNTGHVVFAVYPGHTVELTSTAATYLDGNWHLAVGSIDTATGMSLSVDGGTPVTNTTKSAQSYTGYWHVGWDNERSGWSDPPTNPFFNGTLADAAVFPTVLTIGQVANLYGSGTQGAWDSAIDSDGATRAWTLGDSGTAAYQGTIPGVAPSACSFVDATIGATAATATCAAPVSSSSCAAPSSAVTLFTVANRLTSFTVFPSPTQTVSLIWTVARDATNKTASYPDAVGLHLTVPLTVVVGASGFSASLSWPAEDVVL